MHSRHRNTGNGYRSGSMGMGISASRISPEGSMRGHGLYGSDYRSFNRGYGRGQGSYPKSHQPPPPTPLPRKSGDIFMEAGRLAAEYLVSQGVLPPSVLSAKWQNGSLKRQASDFHEFRSQERIGVSPSDVGRRRYADDYSSTGSRNHLKGRRKGGSYRYGSDFGREYERSGSWSDRSKVPTEMEVDDDYVSGHREELPVAEDIASSLHRSTSGEFSRKREGADGSESELEKYNLQDEAQSKLGSSSAGKELVNDGEVSKMSEGSSSLSARTGELKDGTGSGGEIGTQTAMEDSSVQHCAQADEPSTKSGIDLLKLCKFAKVPTKTRSALMMKGSKVDLRENIEASTPNVGLPEGSEIPSGCDSPGHSSGNLLSTKTHDSKSPDPGNSKFVDPADHIRDLGPVHGVETGKCHRSQSFSGVILRDVNEKELGLGVLDLRRSYSADKERGEKRAPKDSDLREENKRRKEWLSSLSSKADECFNISEVSENKAGAEEKAPSSGEKVKAAVDHNSLVDNSESSKGQDGESSGGYAAERQLFPRICDLNLMGASDAHESNLNDPMLVYPSISEAKKDPSPVHFDLSMSSSSKPVEYTTRISNGKEIEVIDLENDSAEEVKGSDNLDRKQESAFMGFSHQPQTAAEIPDYNDGLMVEFLNNFHNIPPMQPGINPVSEGINNVTQDGNILLNETGLQKAEGTLGADEETQADDDSIFMSLGEIPLTFLHAWDQPPAQRYEKPF